MMEQACNVEDKDKEVKFVVEQPTKSQKRTRGGDKLFL
jgi:hypothetical protein